MNLQKNQLAQLPADFLSMPTTREPWTDEEIVARIGNCPRLASLSSINSALKELISAEDSVTSQISEIIRRDPSLTARLLRLVNSVFFGLSRKVTNIEEAVFYLGLRQIRELTLATPVIEELNNLNKKYGNVQWDHLWQHSIGTAILTREILALTNTPFEDDTDYIMGLVHNVGKIVMAYVFPEEVSELVRFEAESPIAFCRRERELLGGWDRAMIGAHYLEKHNLSEEVVETVRYHNTPSRAPNYAKNAAAVHIADVLLRASGIPDIEKTGTIPESKWTRLDAWRILFGTDNSEARLSIASLKHTLNRMPQMLKEMV